MGGRVWLFINIGVVANEGSVALFLVNAAVPAFVNDMNYQNLVTLF